MSGILFDTNVLLDIATEDANWLGWSERQFRAAAAQGPILINPIIYAELAPAFATQPDLDGWLDPAVFLSVAPAALCRRLAGRASFREIPARGRHEKLSTTRLLHSCARRSGGTDAGFPRRHPLSDLFSKRFAHHSVANNSKQFEDRSL